MTFRDKEWWQDSTVKKIMTEVLLMQSKADFEVEKLDCYITEDRGHGTTERIDRKFYNGLPEWFKLANTFSRCGYLKASQYIRQYGYSENLEFHNLVGQAIQYQIDHDKQLSVDLIK